MAAFLTPVSSVVVIVLMMALGYILRKNGWFDDSFSSNISKLITQIALPASIFISVQDHLTRDGLGNLFQGLLFPALGVVIGYIIAWLTVKIFKIRPGRRGVFMNTVVNANTIFIGMPLNNALFGSKGLSYFLIYYIINTVSTWAFGVYLIYNDDPVAKNKNAAKKINWRKLLPMPLVGFIVAILWLLTGIKVPAFAAQTLTYVGGLVTPLSLIYIGIVLCDAGLKNFKVERDTILGLIGRFILSPLVLILLIKFVAPAAGIHMVSLMRETFIVQAATPALAVLPILANEAHGDVKYATDIVVMSTVLFIVVVPILMTIIQYI